MYLIYMNEILTMNCMNDNKYIEYSFNNTIIKKLRQDFKTLYYLSRKDYVDEKFIMCIKDRFIGKHFHENYSILYSEIEMRLGTQVFLIFDPKHRMLALRLVSMSWFYMYPQSMF